MDKTPIYGLPYINASDLVSDAPAQFKSMAEGVEKALKEVDDRNNTNGVKPMVATTLANLAKLKGVTGQTGYVTSDTTTANNGPYFWNGSAWLPYATKSMLDQLTQGYETVTFKAQDSGSFQFAGDLQILVFPHAGWMYVSLGSCKCNVGLNNGFPWINWVSGVKPSKDIYLNVTHSVSGNYSKHCTWRKDGGITLVDDAAAGDVFQIIPRLMPIPDGVTFG